ncbi:hypothetical protein DE146DRAFT_429372 [Phaeosphaeria sp. MPI-PUGE-AT-0046c]|nr:hypothetical protein DE146DRAFT_429372 [Phaeosphaeria sp. MPI-PUGE-AT-0046c]
MAANAPYYQMRSGQFVTTPRGTNTTPSNYGSEDDEHGHSATDIASSRERRKFPAPTHTPRQISTEMDVNTPEDHHNMAELLEAATTAADQAAQAMETHVASTAQDEDRRKRLSSPFMEARGTPSGDDLSASKRRRVDVPMDPKLSSTAHGSRGSSKSTSVPPASDSLLNDARAAGVHSAAALFRRPSDRPITRKYTRPPMSKLFMSLHLSPESFLQLQALAKTYMLEPTHPERQNCVGNRGKGDTDMVKLRLFNCVREFLEGGPGEQFFGENVEKPGDKDVSEAARALGEKQAPTSGERLAWPRDGNKIISLVTPLMRRMVTNERQRIYAIETRKGGTQKKDKDGNVEAVLQLRQSPPRRITPQGSAEPHFAPASGFSPGAASSTPQRVTSTVATSSSLGLVDRTIHEMNIDTTDLPLPSHSSEAPRLTNINLFLTLAPHTLSDGVTKPGIKLDQKRIGSEQADQLISYPWDNLLRKVLKLLHRVKARYPAIRDSVSVHGVAGPGTEMRDSTDNLRELAAAANAMQSDTVMTSVEADNHHNGTTPMRGSLSPSNDTTASRIPRYVIKTVGSNGWEVITNAQQWYDLLRRRSRDVWADGVVNLVVELVDVSVDSGEATTRNGAD